MSTKAIETALNEAAEYIGDKSAGSMGFWGALEKAQAELRAIREAARAIQKWRSTPALETASPEDVEAYDKAAALVAAIAKEDT